MQPQTGGVEMENTPYLTTDLPSNQSVLNGKLQAKLNYIGDIQTAVAEGNDRRVYELLDSQKYNMQIRQAPQAEPNRVLSVLVDDMQDELSHHLGQKLIAYLSEKFPFFYYEESQLGVFQLFFGNWWDRRHFGILDPLSVKFIFNDEEYEKLARAVELAESGQRFNAQVIEDTTRANEALQKVVNDQNARDAERTQLMGQLAATEERSGLFNKSAQAEQREVLRARLAQLDAADAKAATVPDLIAENNAQILNYSKEDTILIYEQRAINDAFGSFADFQNAVGSLYVDYVSSLVAEQGGE